MSGFWTWLKGAIATVYASDGLLGIVILVVLTVAVILVLNIDAAALVAKWFGG